MTGGVGSHPVAGHLRQRGRHQDCGEGGGWGADGDPRGVVHQQVRRAGAQVLVLWPRHKVCSARPHQHSCQGEFIIFYINKNQIFVGRGEGDY